MSYARLLLGSSVSLNIQNSLYRMLCESFPQKGTSGLVVVHLVGKVNFQQRVPEPAAVLVDAEHRRAQTKQEHVELSSRWRWEEEQFISKDKSWCRSRRGD